MYVIKKNGGLVVARIIRDYESPFWEKYEHKVLEMPSITLYEKFIQMQQKFIEIALNSMNGMYDIVGDEKLDTYHVYAWIRPLEKVLTYKCPTMDVLNAMACTWRFGTGE